MSPSDISTEIQGCQSRFGKLLLLPASGQVRTLSSCLERKHVEVASQRLPLEPEATRTRGKFYLQGSGASPLGHLASLASVLTAQ